MGITILQDHDIGLVVVADRSAGEEDRLEQGFLGQLATDLRHVRPNLLADTIDLVTIAAGTGLGKDGRSTLDVATSSQELGNRGQQAVALGFRKGKELRSSRAHVLGPGAMEIEGR